MAGHIAKQKSNNYLKVQLENEFDNVGNITNAKSQFIPEDSDDNQIKDKPYVKTESDDPKNVYNNVGNS